MGTRAKVQPQLHNSMETVEIKSWQKHFGELLIICQSILPPMFITIQLVADAIHIPSFVYFLQRFIPTSINFII